MQDLKQMEQDHRRKVGVWFTMAINVTQQRPIDIARQFGVSRSKLGNWMRGDHYPDPFFLVRFVDTYNFSLDWVFRGKWELAAKHSGDFRVASAGTQAPPREAAFRGRATAERS